MRKNDVTEGDVLALLLFRPRGGSGYWGLSAFPPQR